MITQQDKDLIRHATRKAMLAITDVSSLSNDHAIEVAVATAENVMVASLAALFYREQTTRNDRNTLMNVAFKTIFADVHKVMDELARDPEAMKWINR